MDENIEALRILSNISKNLYKSKKSNFSRIKNNQHFNEQAKERLVNQVINPLDLAMLDIGKEISVLLDSIPIYNMFLKNTQAISIYDAAELICEIKDIGRFNSSKSLLAYTGFYPNAQNYNKNLHQLLLRLSHKLVNYNSVYTFVYDIAIEKYSGYNTNQQHIEAMARRVVIKRFLQNLYTHWIKLEEEF